MAGIRLSRRALEAGRSAAPADEPLPVTSDPSSEPAAPSAEGLRALRMRWMMDAQGSASRDYTKALAAFLDLRRRDPGNPNLPTLQTDLERELPRLLPPVTAGQGAAFARERARSGAVDVRTGRAVEPDSLTSRLMEALGRGAQALDPSGGAAGRLERLNAGVVSAAQYPLRGVSALVRPFDQPIPAAVKAGIEGKPALTAATAAADPLGRFTSTGAATGRWTNEPTSWHDVAEAALQRWGKPKEQPWGVETAPGETYTHPLTGKQVRTTGPIDRPMDRELLGVGRAGWMGAATAADVALSPSTYLTATLGPTGKGVQLAGRTIVPGKAVTAIARAPGSLLERGAEALAARMATSPRFSLQAAHRVGRAGELAGKYLGPAQVLEGVPKVAGAIPLGGGKTVGELVGETFDRYHRIRQVKDPALQEQLLRLAQLRESGTAAQTTKWTDQIEALYQGASPEDQRLIRDMIESPDAFDWNVRRRDMPPATSDTLARRTGIAPRDPRAGAIGAPEGVPFEPTEKYVGSGSTTSGPNRMVGQPAAPTAVPGTPDAARYGAIPNHLAGQVPTVTEAQRELVARVENVLRDVRLALEERGLIRPGGRPNYFPRERTRESLVMQKGDEARLEKLGRGVNPRLDWRAGFQEGRKEHSWINDLIDKTNAQIAREAEAKGMSPNLIPHVEDTTSAINSFWQRIPERVRLQLRGIREEPERFLDRPKETLQRYLARATKSVNDLDTLRAVRRLEGEGGPLARPFVREGKAGQVFESYEVPVGGKYDIPVSGPGVMVDRTPAPPGVKRLSRGHVNAGRYREGIVGPPRRPVAGELPGEVPPGGAEAFQGKSPFEPLMSRKERPIYGHVYPQNPAWRQAFPNVSLPRDVAAWIDAFGKPYWANEGFAGLIDQLVVRPLHKVQLPWKVAATSGAGPRFALRNYMSQQVMNLQEYGARAFTPRIQKESHILGLPDSTFRGEPRLEARVFTDRTGRTWSARELREVARQTGLWRTLPEAETWSAIGGPFSDVWSGPAHATRAMGWSDPKAALSAALGKVEAGLQKGARAIGPVNPISKDFAPTKHAFHPLAEYGERQGRMAALLMGLDEGMELVDAANRANKVHVNYQGFSPAFEKYGTLGWPFAKFAVGITPNEVKWAMQYPGRTMFPEHLLRGGEHMVPEEERRRYAGEPKSSLILQAGGRLVGYPGAGGALKEPETARAKGPGRLPYVALPPTADVFLNTLGLPARVASSRDRGAAFAGEALEGALPAFKAPYEIATGRNVVTQEPIDLAQAVIAPRAVQALYEEAPGLARILGASPVVDRKTGTSYIAVPQKVALVWRYFPNVAATDLVAGVLGVRRPYDSQTAMALRLLGVTHVLHDPQITATQEAFAGKDAGAKLRKRVESWTPPRTP